VDRWEFRRRRSERSDRTPQTSWTYRWPVLQVLSSAPSPAPAHWQHLLHYHKHTHKRSQPPARHGINHFLNTSSAEKDLWIAGAGFFIVQITSLCSTMSDKAVWQQELVSRSDSWTLHAVNIVGLLHFSRTLTNCSDWSYNLNGKHSLEKCPH